ncbi:DUF397 domain-containing protein [Amycolatopsis sp. NPDC047767]|uniref:DUF397 domain-containing protein n=1 Tax=Amycolatopsis sp. NPDC047767 TaxID=3156765 RepID=UPI00345416F3
MYDEGAASAVWRKSSYSVGQNECVEVAVLTDSAAVRDTKDRASGQFMVARAAWTAFLERVSQ